MTTRARRKVRIVWVVWALCLLIVSVVAVRVINRSTGPDPARLADPLAGQSGDALTAPTVALVGGTDAASGGQLSTLALIDQLTIAIPVFDPPYDRDLFEHWTDEDDDGCDARSETLLRQSLVVPVVTLAGTCEVISGSWRSTYDGSVASRPTELDIDHVVALGEAWVSGARDWTAERRRAFANDPVNLVAVTAAINRAKGDRDPARWQPPVQGAWCDYARTWAAVKVGLPA
ncbi:MAG: HNH endonuclease family protein [Acidimicrobiales bacterium]